MDCSNFISSDGIRVQGKELGNKAVIMVSRYDFGKADVEVKLSKKLNYKFYRPLSENHFQEIKKGEIKVHFSGYEKDMVQPFELAVSSQH